MKDVIVNFKSNYVMSLRNVAKQIQLDPGMIYIFCIIANCIDYYGKCVILDLENFSHKYHVRPETFNTCLEDLQALDLISIDQTKEGFIMINYGGSYIE